SQTDQPRRGVSGCPRGRYRVGEEHQPDGGERENSPGGEHRPPGRDSGLPHLPVRRLGRGGLALFRAGHPVIVHPRAVSARTRQTAPSTKIANQTSTFSTQTACTGSPVSGACTRWPSPYRGVNEATRSSVEPAGIG